MASHTPDHSAALGQILPEETLPTYQAATPNQDRGLSVDAQVRGVY